MTTALLLTYMTLLLAFSWAVRSGVLKFLLSHGVTGENYTGNRIPSSAGLLIWLTGGAGMLCLRIWSAFGGGSDVAAYAVAYERFFLALTVVFWLGWTDDLIGDRRVKGLRGHLRTWMNDRTVSTGLMKAAGIGIVSLWFVLANGPASGWMPALVSWAVVTLCTNTLNLFDLRPGRAIKVFLAGCAVFAACVPLSGQTEAWFHLAPVIAGACALLPIDLRGRAMLGDTGANVLGFALGSAIALYGRPTAQIAAALILIGITIAGERYSFTALIERVPVLNWFDRLGRNR